MLDLMRSYYSTRSLLIVHVEDIALPSGYVSQLLLMQAAPILVLLFLIINLNVAHRISVHTNLPYQSKSEFCYMPIQAFIPTLPLSTRPALRSLLCRSRRITNIPTYKMSTAAYESLTALCKDISNLSAISGILSWDEQVMMPSGSASSRGQQKATLAAIIHAKSTAPELKQAINGAKALQGLGEYEAANVRDAERNFRRSVGVPPELERRMAVHEVACVQAWIEARKRDDYPSFESSLREMVALTREKAAAMDEGDVYDIMIDTFERGMTSSRLTDIFAQIEKPLGGILEKVLAAKEKCKREIHPALKGGDDWDVAKQAELSSEICKILGFNTDKGRIGK